MAKYTVSEKSYIGEALREPGDVIEVADDVVPGPHMEPFKDDKGREDKAARAAKDKAAENQRPRPGDPDYVGAMIDHAINDGATTGKVSVTSATPAPGVVVDDKGQVRGVDDGGNKGDNKG